MTPCRVVDTRSGQGFPAGFGQPSLAVGANRTFQVQSSATCSIPSIAQAYSFNITVVPSTPIGFITAYPTGQPLPLAGTLVWSQGSITSNAAVVPGGTSGSIDVFANSATDLVIDINGYYVPLTLAQGSGVPTTVLFPWVISAGGFDSSLVISNVSLTPNPAITPQSGTCTFNYFGVGTGTNSAPPAPQTSLAVPGGQTLTFPVSIGSTQWSLHGTPGFYGYIYAICNFKAYAAAVLTALGAGPLTTGISAALPVVINP
jgi:hypothetical protein